MTWFLNDPINSNNFNTFNTFIKLLSTHPTTTSIKLNIMSDNLCGPSTPTKGLVTHLNGDRSLQQDRILNAPTAATSNASITQPHELD